LTTFERRQQLVEILRKQPGLRVPELARLLEVSQGTIRNDLNALNEEGQVKRVRGGAAINTGAAPRFNSFTTRLHKNSAAKKAIASRVAALVEDGDSILMDASTSVYVLAEYLADRSQLRVITNGIEVARRLADNPTHTIILLGGVLNREGTTLSGTLSEQFLQDLHVKLALISCSGFSPELGMTEVHLDEAALKTKIVHTAGQVIALVDSSKFGKVDLTTFAQASQISHLYTDPGISSDWVERLHKAGIPFSICKKDSLTTYTPGDAAARRYRIGFANQSERLPFAVEVRKGLERAAQKAGIVDLVMADNRLNPATALKVAESFLSQNLDLVIEYQIDERMGNRIMSLYHNAGIPVISVDIPMIGATYFGVDNYHAGKMAGKALGEWVRDHWDGCFDLVISLEEPRAGSLPGARISGQLDGFQSITGPLRDEQHLALNSGNTLEVSEKAMRTALKKYPELHRIAVICFNDDVAIGVLEAARQLGREEDIVIIGQGAEQRMRQELSRPGSRIIGSTAYSPETYGEKLVQLALRILRGEQVPPAVYMEHTLIKATEGI
jgi:ribose transport system substrate-binding protein